ncbi:MAG: large conductance mechanosensitive channel protein MscL [Actinobacteria bacterium]|nr:large conductance mechanosensitive channel protein MscL [Actinomycetota bacterium]
MLREFKAFVTKGHVVDLAVAVVIGAAFTKVIDAFVTNLITPLVTIPGKSHFSEWSFAIRSSQFYYGLVIDALITFVIIAAVIFLLVVKPLNAYTVRRNRGQTTDGDPSSRDCPYCLSAIPAAASKCAHCTSEVPVG